MVEVIDLSDDESSERTALYAGDVPSKTVAHSAKRERGPTACPRAASVKKHDRLEARRMGRRPFKIIPVDSRQYNRLPRPRFLPIQPSPAHHDAPTTNRLAGAGMERTASTRGSIGSGAGFDDEEADPDWEYVRPKKRRRVAADEAVEKAPKQHGGLMAQDWEVVRSGRRRGDRCGAARSTRRAGSAGDRKEARAYVKKVIAGIDWEEVLGQIQKLKLSEDLKVPGQHPGGDKPGKSHRSANPATRMKQYWQRVLTKSVMKIDLG